MTVTSPSAGENWKTTQTYTIRWTTTSTKPYVYIYLNKNISSRLYTIASSVPNNGQYVWTIPADTLMNKDDEGYTYYLAVCTDDCCPDGQNFGIFFPIPSTPTWFTSTPKSSNSIELAWVRRMGLRSGKLSTPYWNTLLIRLNMRRSYDENNPLILTKSLNPDSLIMAIG